MCKILQMTSRVQIIKYDVNCLKNDVSGLKNAKYKKGPGTYQIDQCYCKLDRSRCPFMVCSGLMANFGHLRFPPKASYKTGTDISCSCLIYSLPSSCGQYQ